jgi:hypothetical protein
VSQSYSTPTSLLTSQYETLRRAALGEALLPQARSGLAVFLYRGMWGWARTLSASAFSEQSLPDAQPTPSDYSPHIAVIQLLATLAMLPQEARST